MATAPVLDKEAARACNFYLIRLRMREVRFEDIFSNFCMRKILIVDASQINEGC